MKKTTKNVIGTGITLGIGNSVLNAIPGGNAYTPALGKGGKMLGVYATASYGNDIIKVMSKKKRGY